MQTNTSLPEVHDRNPGDWQAHVYFSPGLLWLSLNWSHWLHSCPLTIHFPPNSRPWTFKNVTQIVLLPTGLLLTGLQALSIKAQMSSLLTRPFPMGLPQTSLTSASAWLFHFQDFVPAELPALPHIPSRSLHGKRLVIHFSAPVVTSAEKPPCTIPSLFHLLPFSPYHQLNLVYTPRVLFRCHHTPGIILCLSFPTHNNVS